MIQLFEVVNFTYFYRDGANWKNGGNTQFTNKQGLPIEEIDKRIRAAMLDGNCQFHPEDVDLDNYFYCDCQYENGDHHEFDGVAFSQSAVRPERDINRIDRGAGKVQGRAQQTPTAQARFVQVHLSA